MALAAPYIIPSEDHQGEGDASDIADEGDGAQCDLGRRRPSGSRVVDVADGVDAQNGESEWDVIEVVTDGKYSSSGRGSRPCDFVDGYVLVFVGV